MNLLFLSVPAFPFREDGPVSVLDRLALGVRGLRARPPLHRARAARLAAGARARAWP